MSTKIVVLLLLALCATAMADPRHGHGHGHGRPEQGNRCFECNSCRANDNWCFANCKRNCGGINIEQCKTYGANFGYNAAKASCDLTETFCKGMSRTIGAPQRTIVSLAQCGNVAYGVCQQFSQDRYKSPCGWAFDRGMFNCNKDEFWRFCGAVAEGGCNAATAGF